MEIRDEHIEYEVVRRLNQMLQASPSTMEVTHALAMFSSIVCWVVQRIRTVESDKSKVADAARGVLQELRTPTMPCLPLRNEHPPVCMQPSAGILAFYHGGPIGSAEDLLIHIRDAIAHGDGRRMLPWHQARQGGLRALIGMQMKLYKKSRGADTLVGDLWLNQAAMKSLGGFLSNKFCERLSAASGQSQFAQDAASISELSA